MRNPIETDESPRTCHDCDAPLGADPFTLERGAPIGRVLIALCPDCARPYLASQIGIDDEDDQYAIWRESTR